jgi:hypothetical protein
LPVAATTGTPSTISTVRVTLRIPAGWHAAVASFIVYPVMAIGSSIRAKTSPSWTVFAPETDVRVCVTGLGSVLVIAGPGPLSGPSFHSRS